MATIPEALAIAIEHRQGGRLEAAAEICRRILRAEPKQADAVYVLGLIAQQIGKLEEAVVFYRRAIELRPDFAEAYSNLGNTLQRQGKVAEAVACYRRALELKPDFAPAYHNLGVALREQGKLEEAIACYRRALELSPDLAGTQNSLGSALREIGKLDLAVASHRRAVQLNPAFPEAHNNLGFALKQEGKLEEAIAAYRRAVELKPDYALAHNNLAVALTEQGDSESAIASCRRAIELKPGYAEAHVNLGNILKDHGRPEQAVACYRRALELKPALGEVYSNLGNLLKDQGKLQEAIVLYRRCLELRPDFAEGYSNLGNALVEIGDFRGAEDALRGAIQRNPRLTKAHYSLAEVFNGKLPQQDLAAQQRLLAEADLSDSQRLFLHFSLARAHDARAEYAAAATHLEEGNSLQLADWRRRGQPYDPQAYELLVTQIIDVCTPEFFARLRAAEPQDPASEGEPAVFVVGLPRSGTTLVEQILASHSSVFGAGEIGFVADTYSALGGDPLEGMRRLSCETARSLAARHLERLRAMSPAALRIVDKMPENYVHLGLLAAIFPRAKLIHCRRDLRDVAVSCWMTRFEQLHWANDRRHIASRFRQYERIMDHWRKVLPVPLLEMDYEETVADLERAARRLVAWCGLDWEPACLEFHRAKRPVSTASSVQVRQPVFSTSVDRWRHYEAALGSLFAELDGLGINP